MPDPTREERETILRRNDAEDTWDVFTQSPVVARQLERKGWKLEKDHQRHTGWSCRVPLSAITFRKVGGRKRTASPKTLAALARARDSRNRPVPEQEISGQGPQGSTRMQVKDSEPIVTVIARLVGEGGR